ncbi:MAG: MBOAT family protein [Anaerolineales bacterium]|nr:MBOAT family protein [Anaerolineales bacterium]
MNFNTTSFLIFFVLFFLAYIAVQRWGKVQNLLLLAASYLFYGMFDLRYLVLISLVIVVDFSVGRGLGRVGKEEASGRRWRRLLLLVSIATNLAVLGVFKYFNFFFQSATALLQWLGLELHPFTLQIALPLGISFLTLKSLSYTIDVFQGRLKPANSILDYAIYVAFFPQLLAGPIDRAAKLLPQIQASRSITSDKISVGLMLILSGYFKKLVIADNLGYRVVDPVFSQLAEHAGLDILLAVLAFTFQLYADFSGYTDIARGIAYLMGFETALNFRLPYFSLNPTDFWQRWHITFSEWLRDYIFFPLRRAVLRWHAKGSAVMGLLLPPLATMFLSGLWHGAGWTFVLWGLYHGVLLIIYRVVEKRPIHNNPWGSGVPAVLVAARLVLFFFLTCFGWLIFRAQSVGQIGELIRAISFSLSDSSLEMLRLMIFFITPLVAVQIWQYLSGNLWVLAKVRLPVRVLVYGVMILWIIVFTVRETQEFIYVQF